MWSKSLRRTILAGSAALALGGATIGFALAQQAPMPAPNRQEQGVQPRPGNDAFLQALATKLGVTLDRLRQAISEARSEVAPQGRRPEGPRPFVRGGPGPLGIEFRAAAQSIGITAEQLRQELPGKSLADVARAHGKNPTEVATALKNAASQMIDRAVANARLTAERAADMKQRLAERIDALINRASPQRLGELRRRPASGAGRRSAGAGCVRKQRRNPLALTDLGWPGRRQSPADLHGGAVRYLDGVFRAGR